MKKHPDVQRVGLIDVGSNTIRLVIFEIYPSNRFEEIQNIKTPARLVQYVKNGKMSSDGIKVLKRIITSFLKVSEQYQLDDMIAVATAAIRNSKNSAEIIQAVQEASGLKLRILSDTEEAFYGNYAVRHTIGELDAISIDIGGGSTELTFYQNKEVIHSHSFPFGAVSLKQEFFEGKDHNDQKAAKKLSKWVSKQFKEFDWIKKIELPLVGIGGSVRNVADVYQLAHQYPIAGLHEYRMSPEQINETLDLFLNCTLDELQDLDGLSADRADTIIPATIVLKELLDVMDSEEFIISNQGLREGILIDYLNQNHQEPYDLFSLQQQQTIRLSSQYNVHSIAANQRIMIADLLLQALEKEHLLEVDSSKLQMIYYGATLYYMGHYIEDDSESQHSFYIISNTNLFGFAHKERVCLALLASYKNRSLYHQYLENFEDWFSDEEIELMMKLGSLIKFAEALNDSHVNTVTDLTLSKHKDGYLLTVTYTGEIIAEEYRAYKQKNHFERVVKDPVEIEFISLAK